MTKLNQHKELVLSLAVLIVMVGICCTFFIIYFQPPKKEVGIELTFASDSAHSIFPGIKFFSSMRKYTTYNLTSDSLTNIKELEKVREKLNRTKENKDTINGVHIFLDNRTPYSYFIKAINICYERDPATFAPNNNDIYAWYELIKYEP